MRLTTMFLVLLLTGQNGYCDELDDFYVKLREGDTTSVLVPTGSTGQQNAGPSAVSDLRSHDPIRDPISVTINNDAHTIEHSTTPEPSHSWVWFGVGLLAGGAGGYLVVKHWR